MPELPEVETIRLGLEKYLRGHTIKDIEIRLPKIVRGEVKKVQGAKVQRIRRRGKGLILDLDNEWSLAAHVKMTGQFIYQGKNLTKSFHPKLNLPESLPNKWTHVIFQLDDATLFYNDIRQFGWIEVVKTNEVLSLPFFKNLGLEPPVVPITIGTMEGQAILSLDAFKRVVVVGKLPIKQLLMDQKRIAGVGNIYANDALWLAKINPARSANSLTDKEIKQLYEAVLFVLQEGLKYQGASETNFFHVDGAKGGYQDHFLVYGKTKLPCTRCGTLIERTVLGGRGTFFCPHCQK